MKTWIWLRVAFTIVLLGAAVAFATGFNETALESSVGAREAIICLWEGGRTAAYTLFTAVMVGIAWAMITPTRWIGSQTAGFLLSPWLPGFLFLLLTAVTVAAYRWHGRY